MTEETPIACSLGAAQLEDRLAAIAEIGASGLIAHSNDGGRHWLRFRAEPVIAERLEAIVAAESECCSFLDMSLSREGDELVLTIGAPEDAQAVADELAGAFTGTAA
jgi:hypothetical protein